MRKFLILSSFFLIAPLFLLFTIGFYSFISFYKAHPHSTLSQADSNSVAYAALPITQDITSGRVIQTDARVEIVRQFFQRYGSRLQPFASDIVASADQYGLDFRLLPAIAMQESNLCQKEIPGTFNCWGFGIYGKKVTKFDNYQQAISVISKTLALQYKDKGLSTPEEIMSKYNPSNHNGWAQAVSGFMDYLQ